MKRKAFECVTDKKINDQEPIFSGEEDLLHLLIVAVNILSEIKELVKPASGQLNDLHKLIMPKPKETVIPLTIEELLAKHIQIDLLKKKRKK